jgi:hypothetical protein
VSYRLKAHSYGQMVSSIDAILPGLPTSSEIAQQRVIVGGEMTWDSDAVLIELNSIILPEGSQRNA